MWGPRKETGRLCFFSKESSLPETQTPISPLFKRLQKDLFFTRSLVHQGLSTLTTSYNPHKKIDSGVGFSLVCPTSNLSLPFSTIERGYQSTPPVSRKDDPLSDDQFSFRSPPKPLTRRDTGFQHYLLHVSRSRKWLRSGSTTGE